MVHKISNSSPVTQIATQEKKCNPVGNLQQRKVVPIDAKKVLQGDSVNTGRSRGSTAAIVILCILFFPIALPILFIKALADADRSYSRRSPSYITPRPIITTPNPVPVIVTHPHRPAAIPHHFIQRPGRHRMPPIIHHHTQPPVVHHRPAASMIHRPVVHHRPAASRVQHRPTHQNPPTYTTPRP